MNMVRKFFKQTWFEAASFPDNMKPIWDKHFGFIQSKNIGHVLIGEFGIGALDSDNGHEGIWFKEALKYFGATFSWTFWCWNPNSGDTGGMLQYDWKTLNQWKLDLLKPYMAPLIE